jgi:GNAT superfamily N-acetyltransferase
MKNIDIQSLNAGHLSDMVSAFAAINWFKPMTLFERYLEEQQQHKRSAWIALFDDVFAGYVTLKYTSSYNLFLEDKITEIKDLNVLPQYQNKGIGSELMNRAEKEAFARNNSVGIGVGVTDDYRSAHRLYIQRGYKPVALTCRYQNVHSGQSITINDDVCFMMIKLRP